MCGRDAVQVRGGGVVSLDALADRLSGHAEVRRSHSMLYIEPHRERASIALFADGRAIVRGTGDPGVARAIFERVVGR
jgi:adenylyltransferase/sulfurtransferase